MSTQPSGGTLPTEAARPGTARGWRLLCVYSSSEALIGVPRVLSATPFVVGREAEGLTLPDPTASREHAAFALDGGAPVVRDLGSRNGIHVDGRRTTEATLTAGSVIRIGDHVLVLQSMDEADVARVLSPPPRSARLLGEGVAMRALRERIAEVAPGRAPVLVTGESGVGKELVAAEVHERSTRQGAFVPVNCAAIPEELAESELFGHAKGAFSGALVQKEGLFAAAAGGTIFLDEIAETSAASQARLLRVLESGEVRRVGETASRVLDVRVVAATNVDLETAVAAGRFRGDLYARLRAHVLRVAPLRERREDTLGLVVAYDDAHDRRPDAAAPADRIARALTADAAEALVLWAWPWNVRELVQVVRALPREPRPLRLSALPPEIRAPLALRAGAVDHVSSPRIAILEVRPDAVPSENELRTVITHFGGNVARVAAFFGKERRQIYRWAERFCIDLDAARDE